MARAPTEEPEGIVYEPELLFESRTPKPGEPVHSIPPRKDLRHSIAFRTLRNRE